MPSVSRWSREDCELYGFKDGKVCWYPVAHWGWTLRLGPLDIDVSREMDGDLRVDVLLGRRQLTIGLFRWGMVVIARHGILRLGWRA